MIIDISDLRFFRFQIVESLFWLELCDARAIGLETLRARLLGEADQLTAIFAASITARQTAARGGPLRGSD
jgi:hypothetical protein